MVFYAGELERAIMSSFKKATEYDSFKIPKGYAIACLLRGISGVSFLLFSVLFNFVVDIIILIYEYINC